MKRLRHVLPVAAALVLPSAPAAAVESDLAGFVAGDLRLFAHEARFAEQERRGASPSLLAQPELRVDWNDGRERFTLIPFLRFETDDPERRHFDLREAHWQRFGDDWDLLVGVGKVFWGVAESRHLVDVVNQVDAVEDVDEEDRLGQPMIRLSWFTDDWGTWTALAMTGFRERTFPGPRGRLRTAVPVDADDARYQSKHGRWAPELAARWSIVLGDFDVGLSHFWGTGREPRLVPNALPPTRLVPVYDRIQQTGLDAQATLGNWLWKLEAMTRGGHGDRFAALVGGLEYSFWGVFGTNVDLGLIGELLYDGRDVDEAPPTPFDDDLFGGLRIALNDIQSSELLAGAIVDREEGSAFALLEASRRIGNRWTVELNLRLIENVPRGDLLESFERDDYAELRISRYF